MPITNSPSGHCPSVVPPGDVAVLQERPIWNLSLPSTSPSVLRPKSFTVSPARVAVVQVPFVPAPLTHSTSFARPHFVGGDVQPSQLSFQPRYTAQCERTYSTTASETGA